MWLMRLVRPLFYLWAGLNAIDTIGFATRVLRLGVAVVRSSISKKTDHDYELCQVCDDVMGDLLAGSDGVSAIPCRAACFRFPNCVQMCETVQQASQTSVEFPCVSAGFCKEATEEEGITTAAAGMVTSCQDAPNKTVLWVMSWPSSCQPRRYCHRVRTYGLNWKCQLRPGMKRWTGLQQLAQHHTVALAAGFLSQKHCSEPNAGPYCISSPRGFSRILDVVGNMLALLVGGFQSILAIHSPGGSDDRQWLIFWLILALLLFMEHHVARVLLSWLPIYYQLKFAAIMWLLWGNGSDWCYRRMKRFLQTRQWIISRHGQGSWAQQELQTLQQLLGVSFVRDMDSAIQRKERRQSMKLETIAGLNQDWEWDPDAQDTSVELLAMKELYHMSSFLLSAEGAELLASRSSATAMNGDSNSNDTLNSDNVNRVLERAAACASFQPRFVNITLVGTTPTGPVPVMDSNGLADPYVVCQLVSPTNKSYPPFGKQSSTCFKTRHPQWHDERIEIALQGGQQDDSGYYYVSPSLVGATQLHFRVLDADVGRWSILYQLFRVLTPISIVTWWAFSHQDFVRRWMHKQRFVSEAYAQWLPWIVIGLMCLGYWLSYWMAVVGRVDDDCIGECHVPLSILMDQGEHALLLTLKQQKKQSTAQLSSDGAGTTFQLSNAKRTNHRGVIRVRLSLSEN